MHDKQESAWEARTHMEGILAVQIPPRSPRISSLASSKFSPQNFEFLRPLSPTRNFQ